MSSEELEAKSEAGQVVSRLASAVKDVGEALDGAELDPDPARRGLQSQRVRIDELQARVENDVLGAHDELAAALGEPKLMDVFGRATAQVSARTAVLVAAAGDPDSGRRLMERAAAIAPAGTQLHAELQAALHHPVEHALLVRARWLLARGEREAAVGVARLLYGAGDSTLRAAARQVEEAPRALASAPPLFRLNGFGVGLYGSRDERPDGTHVATYFISALWIPIFPLAAYRVKASRSNGYYFHARVSLGPVAKVWRSVVALGAALAIAGGVIAALLSP